jgi:predicted PurR-regulated permease PerM
MPAEGADVKSRGRFDRELEHRLAAWLWDVLVRIGLGLVLVVLCYRIFSPFLTLAAWALILAVSLYPLHQAAARRMGGRQGLAATLLVMLGVVLIVVPSALLVGSLGDSVHRLIHDVQTNALQIPPPSDAVAKWPVVGPKLHALWTQGHTDLPAVIKTMQPQIGDLARGVLGFVAGIGGGLLQFLAAFVIAGIVMAFGEAGDRATRAIFARVFGRARGNELAQLSTAIVRAVAQGVIGVAFIQAMIIGVCLLAVGVPWAGVLALIVLVLGIAQVPALVVTLPAIGYIWWSGDYGNVRAIVGTAVLLVGGMADNVLKPLLLGRGVEAPMPVILLGALGGMATGGLLGLFVGATLLTLGYRLFMVWVADEMDAEEPPRSDDDTVQTEAVPTDEDEDRGAEESGELRTDRVRGEPC